MRAWTCASSTRTAARATARTRMLDLRGQAVVAVMTRAPSAGGKSRLFASLGRPCDAALLRALLLDTLDGAAAPGLTRVICFTPHDAERELRALALPDVALLPQRGTDLGTRMRAAFDDLLAAGARAAVLIGSDLPALDRGVIAGAHRVLADEPRAVVLGPAADGGYYLIGATRTPAELFEQMPWGTAAVLDETERRARAAGIRTHRVAAARDVDTADDLRHVVAATMGAARTRAWWRASGVPPGSIAGAGNS